MGADRVVKGLYRSLMRMAAKFDASAESKMLLYRKSNDPLHDSGASVYFSRLTDELLGGHRNMLSPLAVDTVSIRALVRSKFREQIPDISQSDRVDACFNVVRKLSSVWSSYQKLVMLERRTVNSCSDIIAAPADSLERGVLLVSHPLLDGPMRRAVVLVLEHGEHGSYGLVINRPTTYSLYEACGGLPQSVYDTFGTKTVNYGGSTRRIQYLHDIPNVGGSPIPNDGSSEKQYYFGGEISKILSTVKTKRRLRDDVKFYIGCCVWEKEVLENELKTGFWTPVRASMYEALLSNHPSVSTMAAQDGGDDDSDESDNDSEESNSKQLSSNSKAKELPTTAKTLEDSTCEQVHNTDSPDGVSDLDFLEMDPRDQRLGVWEGVNAAIGCHSVAALPNWAVTGSVESLDWK
jgi:putative transcriptional regulator